MLKPLIISLCLLPLTLTTQACGQSIEVNEEPNTTPVTVKAIVPKSVPMTLEEIRAEQEKIEAQIAEIKAKGELERADKIALLKLARKLHASEKVETQMLGDIIKNQKERLANEFASIRGSIQE